jgi:RhtB (resistance to homoserine/threonine) family protein
MEYLTSIILIGTISLFAAMSPGPDFAVVMKNILFGSRTIGLFTAVGVGFGILLHVAYSLLGIGLIISQSIILFTIIKYAGAIYLFYLAYQLLKSKPTAIENSDGVRVHLTSVAALREGFFTNALNPKATLFFLSIFTQVINPDYSLIFQALLGLEVAVIVMLWFTTLALVITYQPIKSTFMKGHHLIMKLMGGALLLLGVRLAFETRD